jgi:hypothetical protein
MDLSTVANIAQISSVIIPMITGMWAIWRAVDKRLTQSLLTTTTLAAHMEAIQKQLDVQFGGNGGGIREAVNTIKTDMKVLESKVDKAAIDIGNLSGKFEQHIIESERV